MEWANLTKKNQFIIVHISHTTKKVKPKNNFLCIDSFLGFF